MEEVHAKLRKYICEHCHFTTVRKRHLDAHISARHDKIRKYACEWCDYAAAQSSTLKRHTMTMHENK